ncbi:tRNA (adenosine(37)-N6)-threonylcarbamoyltransferase complex dimerization subunit type 1 TsaB [Georgenia sp. Z1491]|uniref:tRNA (adenosine(37)-N6)-threonylcarbamoyltransferase complex dimerization subunit type 1 TsaB n=1 Tax=Georgenia sp. Z1491 TaxID=3416707 RepID=UPI003CEEFB87
MRVLVIDTSSRPVAACIDAVGGDAASAHLLGHVRGVHDRRHAEELAPAVAELVGEHGTPDLVVVGTGPGPFTGLRVGLVTARALARGWGAALAGVPSLDAVARDALDDAPGATVVVATDARRREVHHGRYRARGAHEVEVLAAPAVAAPADVRRELEPNDVVVGEMAPAVTATDDGTGDHGAREVEAGSSGAGSAAFPLALARLALARLAAGEELPAEPLYLRRPDAAVPAQVRP